MGLNTSLCNWLLDFLNGRPQVVRALTKGTYVHNPLLQLLNVRRIIRGSGPPRFHLVMSDGLHTMSTFWLVTKLNCLVEKNCLLPYCVCLLKRRVTNILKDGRCMVTVLEMEVVMSAEEVGGKIGTPTPYVEGKTTKITTTTIKHQLLLPSQDLSMSSPGQRRTLQNQVSAESHAAASTSTASPHNQPRAASSFTRDPAGRGDSGKKTLIVVPIACLSPYQTKWTIRARVTKKNNTLPWSNLRREVKLFSFEIVDESGEIGVTAFDKEVDKFFSLLETGKVYYISRGKLKEANKKYNTLKNNYEMTLLSETSIVPCEDDQDLPMVECDFILTTQLEHTENDDIIDVIGVCRSVDDLSSFTDKTGRQEYKRDIHLVYTSGKAVAVTLWGEQTEMFDGSVQPIVAIKRARLSDFGGQSVSAIFSSAVMVNPDIPEAHRLRRWYDQEGHALDGQSLTELRPAGGGANTCWKTLSDVKTEQLGDKADYFSCVATVLFSGKESCLYQACPSADCKKKVIEQPNGLYHCEKCDKQFPNYKYCCLLSANIADFSDNQWVTCFHETAEGTLGHNAETLGLLKDTDDAAFDEVFQKVNFTTHIFRNNRVKLETYNDESRVKAMVMEVKPLDHREYSRRLISNIRNMAA
uniref:replication protein A 70 kDa DNA-binding subunit-like n=1 Tax=Oncorhynchus gorbuscha TaxID=8017 RepID=UPI001EAF42D2|nr:replication protein A 70 kDa DNA-binding subunit-like [Oncorhynchus gorbuscha]